MMRLPCLTPNPSPQEGIGMPTVFRIGYVEEMGTILIVYTNCTNYDIIAWCKNMFIV